MRTSVVGTAVDGATTDIEPAAQQARGVPAAQQARVSELRAWLREYGERRLEPWTMDKRRSLSPGFLLEAGRRGLLGLLVSEAEGGLGLGYTAASRVVESMAGIDLTLALFVGLSNVLGTRPIDAFGTADVRARWIEPLAQGRCVGAFALTEPEAGSNPRAMQTRAERTAGGGFVLRGQKHWIGNAAWSSLITVFARTRDSQGASLGVTAFAVESDTPGVRIGPESPTLGLRATAQSVVTLEDVRVPESHVLGGVGAGLVVAEDAIRLGRLGIAAICSGSLKRAVRLGLRYAGRRTVATGRLIEHPLTRHVLAELTRVCRAIEHFWLHIAQALDEGRSLPLEVFAACKVFSSEELWTGVDRILQLLGGRGYIETNGVAQLLRDARILRIFEGPSETLTAHIGSSILAGEASELRDYFAAGETPGAGWQELGAAAGAIESLWATCFQESRRAARLDRKLMLRHGIGRLGVWAILGVAVPAAEEELRTWVRERFGEEQRRLLAELGGGAWRSPLELEAEVDRYRDQIGDVEPIAAGEQSALDSYLSRAGG